MEHACNMDGTHMEYEWNIQHKSHHKRWNKINQNGPHRILEALGVPRVCRGCAADATKRATEFLLGANVTSQAGNEGVETKAICLYV